MLGAGRPSSYLLTQGSGGVYQLRKSQESRLKFSTPLRFVAVRRRQIRLKPWTFRQSDRNKITVAHCVRVIHGEEKSAGQIVRLISHAELRSTVAKRRMRDAPLLGVPDPGIKIDRAHQGRRRVPVKGLIRGIQPSRFLRVTSSLPSSHTLNSKPNMRIGKRDHGEKVEERMNESVCERERVGRANHWAIGLIRLVTWTRSLATGA